LAEAAAANDKRIDILALLPGDINNWANEKGCKRYVLPLEKAKQKVLQLLERVANGEIEYFAVSLHE